LERVAKVIVKKPNAFNMTDWIVTAKNTPHHGCNTVACIAGHVVLQAGFAGPAEASDSWLHMPRGLTSAMKSLYQRLRSKSMYTGRYYARVTVAALATELLTEEFSLDTLFYVNEWPFAFRKPYYSSTSVEEQAEIAAKRIHHLLKTGE